jgi:hypothetical protein
MSGMQNQRLVDKPPAPPLDFPRGKLVYTGQIRRRNRQYRLSSHCLFLLSQRDWSLCYWQIGSVQQ